MNTIELSFEHLSAALICAANKDIRYYLNGVLVDIREREVRVVATDGYRLIVMREVLNDGDEPHAPAQIIIPREVLKGIKPAAKAIVKCVLHYDAENPLEPCALKCLKDADRGFTPIDGTFPDFERILPKERPSGERAYFDADYLADFKRIAEILGVGHACVFDNGNDACAPVTFGAREDAFGVLMPMLWDSEYKVPEWVAGRAEERKAA